MPPRYPPPRLRLAGLLAVLPREVGCQTFMKQLKNHNLRLLLFQGSIMAPKSTSRARCDASRRPLEAPRSPKNRPRGHQEAAKRAPGAPTELPRGLQEGQRGSQEAPTGPQEASKSAQEAPKMHSLDPKLRRTKKTKKSYADNICETSMSL